MEFKNKMYKLNQLLEVIYENEEGHLAISMGRLYDYSCKYISIDCSEDYWDLEDTLTIPLSPQIKIYFTYIFNFVLWNC